MEKSKKQRRRRKSHLDFVSPISLEECIYRLERLGHVGVTVEIQHNDGDVCRFEAHHFLQNRVKNAAGELHRWEGTLTSVRCKPIRQNGFTLKGFLADPFNLDDSLLWILEDVLRGESIDPAPIVRSYQPEAE